MASYGTSIREAQLPLPMAAKFDALHPPPDNCTNSRIHIAHDQRTELRRILQ